MEELRQLLGWVEVLEEKNQENLDSAADSATRQEGDQEAAGAVSVGP